jgi:hypothetical protein
MSAALVLPFLWATAVETVGAGMPGAPPRRVEPEMAFYRKYTEAMLRRYVRMSMEAGKVSSLLGQELFRGNVTSCRVEGFDDVVIFKHDVERCLARLDPEQHDLVSRMAIQEYTVGETAVLMGIPPRTVIRRYARALERLTRIFLAVKMLKPQNDVKGQEPHSSL